LIRRKKITPAYGIFVPDASLLKLFVMNTKKLFFLLLLLSPFANVFAQEKKVKPLIEEVTVFLSGAQIEAKANVSLSSGTSDVVFEGLPADLNESNLQAKGEGDFVILSVVKRMNYLGEENADLPKDIRILKDSLDNLRDKLSASKGMQKIYDKEEEMLMANKYVGGANVGVNAAELEKNANLIRNRLTDIQFKRLDALRKEKKLAESIDKLTRQLNDLNIKKQNSADVVITVMAKAPVNAKLMLNYWVANAGWTPYYDIRAIDNKNPVKIEYRAKVWQNTGEKWDKVKLTLSTGNPTQDGTKPVVNPWFINISDPVVYKQMQSRGKKRTADAPMAAPSMDMSAAMNGRAEEVMAQSAADYTVISEGQVSASFDIAIPYSISSDGKPHIVEVQNFSAPATYTYYCAPKIDKEAILLARINGWDQYNLLSGEANIFFEGMLVGKSFIDVANTNDTLDISLGRDKSVVVTRTKLKDFSEKKTIGTQKKETLAFEIVVRNKKKQDIEIEIEDQVPLTQNAALEVELIEKSGAKHNPETGKISWPLKVKAGDSQKVRLSFSVKYPKEKVLTNF
jgi:uncharacterized protein (TIGR02231 family)